MRDMGVVHMVCLFVVPPQLPVSYDQLIERVVENLHHFLILDFCNLPSHSTAQKRLFYLKKGQNGIYSTIYTTPIHAKTLPELI